MLITESRRRPVANEKERLRILERASSTPQALHEQNKDVLVALREMASAFAAGAGASAAGVGAVPTPTQKLKELEATLRGTVESPRSGTIQRNSHTGGSSGVLTERDRDLVFALEPLARRATRAKVVFFVTSQPTRANRFNER